SEPTIICLAFIKPATASGLKLSNEAEFHYYRTGLGYRLPTYGYILREMSTWLWMSSQSNLTHRGGHNTMALNLQRRKSCSQIAALMCTSANFGISVRP
ncbi:hypothetical protein Hypma_016550, partial [Hypsizygus marmoreus]